MQQRQARGMMMSNIYRSNSIWNAYNALGIGEHNYDHEYSKYIIKTFVYIYN